MTRSQPLFVLPPPDPTLAPPPPSAVALVGDPSWHVAARWMLTGAGATLTLLFVVALVLVATHRYGPAPVHR